MSAHPFDRLPLPNGATFIFTPCPGVKEANLTDSVATLKQAGATAVVTMLSTEEMAKLNVAELGNEINAAGMQWFQLPVEDDSEPEQAYATAFEHARSVLLNLIADGETIAIHCKGGSGRTGLMAAILLLENGEAWSDVKPLIQSIRPKALTLDPHLNYLQKQYRLE